ncbi:hypothetical protein ACFPRL_30770 [Pseudoclavibacter helvolus]
MPASAKPPGPPVGAARSRRGGELTPAWGKSHLLTYGVHATPPTAHDGPLASCTQLSGDPRESSHTLVASRHHERQGALNPVHPTRSNDANRRRTKRRRRDPRADSPPSAQRMHAGHDPCRRRFRPSRDVDDDVDHRGNGVGNPHRDRDADANANCGGGHDDRHRGPDRGRLLRPRVRSRRR